MRIFAAVDVDDPGATCKIAELQSELAGMGRPVPAENLHFTLQFLGEADGGTVQRVSDALGAVRFEPFDISLQGVGAFPDAGRPRVVWVGAGGRGLGRLAGMVEAALAPLGFARDRPFAPHLTVLRAGRGAAGFRERDGGFGTQRVEAFKLKSSVPGQGGSAYSDLREYPATRGRQER